MNDAARANGAGNGSSTNGSTHGTRIFTGQLFRVRDRHGWAFTDEPPPPPATPTRRPARVAQALALAHRLQAAIDRGDYRDRAELARQLGFTRARVTQLLDLLLLAPDIQERVLDLEAVDGVEPMAERALRSLVRHESWAEQRRAWEAASPARSWES
jgi:hypothetical protein